MKNALTFFRRDGADNKARRPVSPFRAMVRKEIAGHIRSWRFIVLLILVVLTFWGSMYVAMGNLRTAVANAKDPDPLFVYLKLLTTTDGTLPAFHVFLSFLGPLLGISLGFDALNSEKQNGTLTRILAQPVYRDTLLLSKFISSLVLVSALFLTLSLLMVGGGMVITGVLIEPEEVLRIMSFLVICVLYVGFLLSLAILLSVGFRQAATSALTAIGIWLFLTVFYQIGVSLSVKALLPNTEMLSQEDILH